jgi:hypothetical protein
MVSFARAWPSARSFTRARHFSRYIEKSSMPGHEANIEKELQRAFAGFYDVIRTQIGNLEKELAAQRRYIIELEGQLEPEVVNEIRDRLREPETEELNHF